MNKMKSLYLKSYDAFIRYFDIPITNKDAVDIRIYLPGLATPSMSLLTLATHPDMKGHRSLFIDYFGSGFSDTPQREKFDYSMVQHLKTILAILDHENINTCQVIGHSMGGTLGILLALERPGLVKQLIVAEGNIEPGGGPGTSYIVSFQEDEYIQDIFPAVMDRVRERAVEKSSKVDAMLSGMWKHSDPYGLYHSSVSLVNLDPDFKDHFLHLKLPICFIYGQQNLPENSGKVLADAPDPELLQSHGISIGIVTNSGHIMMVDNLDGFANVVSDFLN